MHHLFIKLLTQSYVQMYLVITKNKRTEVFTVLGYVNRPSWVFLELLQLLRRILQIPLYINPKPLQ